MNQTIYNLHYDFEQQNGNYIVFLRDGEQNIHTNDLAKIQVKMLQANSIDRVLPLEVEEMDFQVKLYYNFAAKKMLSHKLRENKLTIDQYYNLLFQVVSVIDKSKEYMLSEQNYILNENLIFTDKDITDIYLTYLPLSKVPDKPSLNNELRNLIISLMSHIMELRGDGIQNLINYLSDPSFNLGELKTKLDALRKQSASLQAPSMLANIPVTKQEPVNSPPSQVDIIPQKSVPSPQQQKQPNPKSTNKGISHKKAPKPSHTNPEVKPLATKKQAAKAEPKNKLIIVLAPTAIAIAAIWKLYEMRPEEGMLYICAGLSLLALTVAYYILAVRKPKSTDENVEVINESNENSQVNKKRPKNKKQQPSSQEVEAANAYQGQKVEVANAYQGQNLEPTLQQAAAVDNSHYFDHLHNQTTLLSEPDYEPDATVLLSGENLAPSAQHGPIPFLEVNRNSGTEKIQITKLPFVIGRNPEKAQYAEKTAGVSRTHIEFEKNGENVAVRDLGSKNGTDLNGQRLVPYKLHMLQDGDQIKVGKVVYTFKTG
ncbi:MAG: DUF6382 domain-containing protein [Anaerobacillus sp.]|uniref:DUF6382 domain-containing protein n=1 Tax=Anaerobacillus sp. TaxID=1872506 RepID=UPI00391A5BBE